MIAKKLIALLTIFVLLFSPVGTVLAQEAPPPAPSAPAAPSAPSAPSAPAAPSSPNEPAPTAIPTAPPAPGPFDPTPTPQPTVQPTPRPTRVPTPTPTIVVPTSSPQQSVAGADQSGGNNANGQTGGATVNTGNANSDGVLVNDINSNLASGAGAGSGSGGAQIINSGNGDASNNSGSAQIVDTSTTFQNNSANIVNEMDQSAVTGNNSASSNTGGDSNITTGDANVSGILLNTVNTNSAGVTMSEFNIADDHMGDYVLDFAANCVYGCGGSTSVANTGNGADSNNSGDVVEIVDSSVFQTNEANIDNSMTLVADSGDNRADRNTGGDSAIITGDANVSASAVTMANNNIAGNVIYGVVNIYGDLVGDIVFPEEYLANCCGGSTTASNTGNGSDSTNAADITNISTDSTVQTNVAAINNNILLDAETGDNDANRNTGGNSSITTGNTDVTASVLNVANSNIAGDWWLVLVNQAGEWVGKIMGAPEGANFLGSEGTELHVDENGEITVSNSGNGDGSTNQGSVTNINNQETIQTNEVTLNNTLDLRANTGGNSTSRNTNGNNSIVTGDATIMANLVNFVNNNISSGGKLVVTVVNVFGSWLGDFVGPGQQKEQQQTAMANNVGGADASTNKSSSSNNSTSATPTPTTAATSTTQSTPITPTPTKSAAYVGSLTDNTSGSGEVAGLISDESGAIVGEVSSEVPSKKQIHINLAWLLLLLPAGGIFLLTKNRFAHSVLPS